MSVVLYFRLRRIYRFHLFAALLFCIAAVALLAGPALAGGRAPQEGQLLRVFDRTPLYVVTNDDPRLAYRLLEEIQPRQRRILTMQEWRDLPEDAAWYVSAIFLINRQNLPAGFRFPDSCLADDDELWIDVGKVTRGWGVAHNATVSAPDAAWLQRGVDELRKLAQAPRQPIRRPVRSLAVVPAGSDAAGAASAYFGADDGPVGHMLSPPRYEVVQSRLDSMDEVILISRDGGGERDVPPALQESIAKHVPRPGETLVWREAKARGGIRAFISAPNGALLAEAAQQYRRPDRIPISPTVAATARDLRGVRRVAVAGARNGVGGADLARRLAGIAASEVRALDAFEVLERAGLAEILGEIALDQAGITRASDRARVRQLAAADALLIVEVTDVRGKTDYSSSLERLTPKLGPPPSKPLEPSRLRFAPTIRGRERDVWVQAATEVLLRPLVGFKDDDDYKKALDYYNSVTLPSWRRDLNRYEAQSRAQTVSWRQRIVGKGHATVTGSLRLVDLADGLVLWEAPFSATRTAEAPFAARLLTSVGEESAPDDVPVPMAGAAPPESLVTLAADAALAEAVRSLPGTALLARGATGPAVLAGDAPPGQRDVASAISGRVLDVDGEMLLIGLGASDGVELGDRLLVSLPDDRTVTIRVTRVRPRTCDAVFADDAAGSLRTAVATGLLASLEPAR